MTVFLLEMHIPFLGEFHDMVEIIFEAGDLLIGFLRIEFQNASHLDLPKLYEVFIGDFAEE